MATYTITLLKSLLGCCLLAGGTSNAGAFGVPDAKAPRHFAGLVSQADHVVIAAQPANAKEAEGAVTVHDQAWIEAFAAVLESAVYQPTSPLLGIGFPVTFVAENGRTLLNLQLLAGGHVRLNQRHFRLGSPTVEEIARLLRAAKATDD
jgi:hypothetical protein